jgi:hypothetical protein
MTLFRKSLMWLLVSSLTGCMVTTQMVQHYDDECHIVTKHVELNKPEFSGINYCRDAADCIGSLVGLGVMSAASAVISGSVVVVGNAVYWLEKQGQCQRTAVAKA